MSGIVVRDDEGRDQDLCILDTAAFVGMPLHLDRPAPYPTMADAIRRARVVYAS